MNDQEKTAQLTQMIKSAAFAEAFAYTLYGIYAEKCREGGLIQAAMKLEEAAANEREHCEQWLKVLNLIPEDITKILPKAATMEASDANEMYANMAAFLSEYFPDQKALQEKAMGLIAAERRHQVMFRALATYYQSGENHSLPGMWVCSHCGNFYFKKEDIPEKCPVCEHEREDYVYIGGEL